MLFKKHLAVFTKCSLFVVIVSLMINVVNPVSGFAYLNSGKDVMVSACSEETSEVDEFSPWGTKAVGAEYAHSSGYMGNGVRLAVIDSGIDIYSEVRACGGVDFEDPEYCRGDDLSGHGTSVAGIIAAPADDSGLIGIAPEARVYNLRVLSGVNAAPVSRIIEALDWCIENDIQIINMSFGTDKYSPALYTKINEAYQHGILIVSSAGNGEELQYPAKFSEVISVGAVDSEMKTAEKTVTDETLDFVAPGINVYSTSLLGGYCAVSGTSAAAAHITGCAAVLLGRDTSRSADFIKNLMIYSCKDLGEKENYGYGMPDLEFALKNYDEFAAEYKEDDEYISVNPLPAEEYIDDDCYVAGQWSNSGHKDLANEFPFVSYNCNYRIPKFIKIASYTCDKSFNNDKLLHGIENYVVAAKLLYEIAVKYKIEGSSFEYDKYECSYKDLVTLFEKPYYGNIMDTIKYMFKLFITGNLNVDNELFEKNIYYSSNLSSDINTTDDTIYSNNDSATDFISYPEKKAALVFGMCFHLLGDIYAHRSIVPTTAISNEQCTCHGEDGAGNNSNMYFVVNDFKDDCNNHLINNNNLESFITEQYNKDKSDLKKRLDESKGLKKIRTIFEFIMFFFNGKREAKIKVRNDKQKDIDIELLKFACDDSNKINRIQCKNNTGFCYGSIKRLAGLGVLQFKDIKFAVKGYTKGCDLTDDMKYYEDQSPSNIFHFERYEVAKKVTNHYIDSFLKTPNAAFNEFDPYYLISESYEGIRDYAVKIDQYYNYLKAYDKNSNILTATYWSNKTKSLFHYTTIVYKESAGNKYYFIDPDTYIVSLDPNVASDSAQSEKPKYYSGVFPEIRKNNRLLKATDFYQEGLAW